MKNSTHTVAYTTIGTSVVKNCAKEGELVGAVGLMFFRGETEVELSLAEPTLGSALSFCRFAVSGETSLRPKVSSFNPSLFASDKGIG